MTCACVCCQRVKSAIAELQAGVEDTEKEYQRLGTKYRQGARSRRVRDRLAQEWDALNREYATRYQR